MEENGYTVIIEAWDFRPSGNWALDMQRTTEAAHITVIVLSENFLKKGRFTQP
ncbi:MAG: toll/interleukin-1 receptor domain-containing protein [Leptolyngbyaceae cyanobacterium]